MSAAAIAAADDIAGTRIVVNITVVPSTTLSVGSPSRSMWDGDTCATAAFGVVV